MSDEPPMVRFQRHYRQQLDSKNRLIEDHLRRQRIYLSRLRDFICRIPCELRHEPYDQLVGSLEKLEVHFCESQEDFCELQCVIRTLDPYTMAELPLDSPTSSNSFDLSSVPGSSTSGKSRTSSRTASVLGASEQTFLQHDSSVLKTNLDNNAMSVMPSSSPSCDNSPDLPAPPKRKRRRVSRNEDNLRSGRGASSGAHSRTQAPRPCSSSSETANSPPSPILPSTVTNCSRGGRSRSIQWQIKTQKHDISYNQMTGDPSFASSKRTTILGSDVCPPGDDNMLPDFSLFG